MITTSEKHSVGEPRKFNLSRLIAFGREASGEKISVVLSDANGLQTTAYFSPNDILNGFRNFQRALLRDGIRFNNSTLESGPARGQRWENLVFRLLGDKRGNGQDPGGRKKRRRPGRSERQLGKARGR